MMGQKTLQVGFDRGFQHQFGMKLIDGSGWILHSNIPTVRHIGPHRFKFRATLRALNMTYMYSHLKLRLFIDSVF